MQIAEEEINGVMIIDLKGQLDSTNAVDFGNRLRTLLGQTGRRLLLDLQYIEYISSAGFRTLLIAARHASKSRSQLALTGINPKVRGLFELGGFLDNFSVFATRDKGLEALS